METLSLRTMSPDRHRTERTSNSARLLEFQITDRKTRVLQSRSKSNSNQYKSQSPAKQQIKVCVILCPDFSEAEYCYLRRFVEDEYQRWCSNTIENIEWHIEKVDSLSVDEAKDIKISSRREFDQIKRCDWLFLLGDLSRRGAKADKFDDCIRAALVTARQLKKTVVAIGQAPNIVENVGLKHRKQTFGSGHRLNLLEGAGSSEKSATEYNWVEDQYIIIASSVCALVQYLQSNSNGMRALFENYLNKSDVGVDSSTSKHEVDVVSNAQNVGIYDELVAEAIKRMECNASQPAHIGELSASLGVSRPYLTRAFKLTIGDSPTTVWHRLKLASARREVVSSALPISTIAFDHGFADTSHFIRVYRRRYGLTPGADRKLNSHANSIPTDC